MAYRSSSTATGNSTAITGTAPVGTAAGDRLLAFLSIDWPDDVVTPPANDGWVQISTNSVAFDGQTLFTFEKMVATGSDSYAFTNITRATRFCIQVVALTGRHGVTASTVSTTKDSTSLTSPVSISLTGVTANNHDDIVVFTTLDQVANATWNFSTITNYTEVLDFNEGFAVTCGTQIRDDVSSGATGSLATTATRTAGTGNVGWGGFVVAVPVNTQPRVVNRPNVRRVGKFDFRSNTRVLNKDGWRKQIYRAITPQAVGMMGTPTPIHTTSGALTGPGSTIAGSSAHVAKHTTSGVLTGQGSTIVGSSAHVAKHTTTGVLTGQGSSIVGASAHKAKHTTTGVLAGLVSAIAGTSRRFRNHPTNGVLTGQSSTIVGSAAHKAKHTTTGVLTGQASTIVGAAKRFITHITSGVLTGQGSIIVGSASRASASNTHVTSGVLTGQSSSIVGSAAHKAKHTTTGVLTGQASSIAGTSAHKTKHTTTGALVGQSAIITGSSVHKAKHTTTGTLIGQSAIITGSSVNGTSVITKRFGIAYWKPDEKYEPIEPIVEETVEEWTEPDLFEKLKETRTMHEAIIKKAQQAELMEEQQRIRLRKAQDDQIIEMYLRSKR